MLKKLCYMISNATHKFCHFGGFCFTIWDIITKNLSKALMVPSLQAATQFAHLFWLCLLRMTLLLEDLRKQLRIDRKAVFGVKHPQNLKAVMGLYRSPNLKMWILFSVPIPPKLSVTFENCEKIRY